MGIEETDIVVIGMGPAGRTPPGGWPRLACT
jgi:hypothetical protein